jgi:tRNA(fMet)-specific endonuclease VapC
VTPADLGDSPILLDTDVFSFVVWSRGPAAMYEPFVVNRLWVLSFATVAELRYGAIKAGWGPTRLRELDRRIRLCVVVPGTDVVATRWAELNAKFKDQVGMNDLWIAACALSQNPVLPVASHDHAFEMIAAEFDLPVVRINAA